MFNCYGCLYRQKDIKVETKVPANLPLAAADSVRVTQVITNILENAIKFSPPGGLVEISALKNEPYIQVQVTDYGIGYRRRLYPSYSTASSRHRQVMLANREV